MAQAQGRPWPRLVAMSRSGRFVALRGTGAIELVDALGTAPRTPIACAELTDFACVGAMLWLLEGRRIRRLALESGRALEIRECLRILGIQPFELGPASELPAQHVQEGLVVPLQNPKPLTSYSLWLNWAR